MIRFVKVEAGRYMTQIGEHKVWVEERAGKAPACWVAAVSGKVVATGGTLRDVRARLGRLDPVSLLPLPRAPRKPDAISNLCARFAAAADDGEPWGSGRLGQEIRAIWPKTAR